MITRDQGEIMETVKYSIVIPLYNEEETLPVLVERLQATRLQVLDVYGQPR